MQLGKIAYLAAGMLVTAGAGFGYLCLRKPLMEAARCIRVPRSEARIARGRYVFTIAACDSCHSRRDFSKFAGPVVEGARGRGNIIPITNLPGRIVAPNITPDPDTGLGSWTDGEKIRAIRDGVDREGRALYPMMPYRSYRFMSDDDVVALVAYLDSLPPIHNPLPATLVNFTASLLIKTVPEPAGNVPPPDRTNPQEYGKYLTTIAGCLNCHTPGQNGGPGRNGRPDLARAFSGGNEIVLGAGFSCVSANITPDVATGIGSWDFDRFVERFRSTARRDEFTIMPWLNYAQLSDEDIEAIFLYLRGVTPIANRINAKPQSLPGGTAASRTSNPESR